MFIHLKIALIAALCLLVFALSAEASGRHLLQPGWDDCHRCVHSSRHVAMSEEPAAGLCVFASNT